uniref:Uncharacterized protein n=1 Tax=Pelagomonas calceolata TaxID=35677 RepID=A0A7S4E314_9STRA
MWPIAVRGPPEPAQLRDGNARIGATAAGRRRRDSGRHQAAGGGKGAARRRRRRAQAGRGRGQGGALPHVEGPAAPRRMVSGVLLTSEHRGDGVEFCAAHAPSQAGISSSVASMVQRWSVQAEAGRKRDRLLDIYTSCNRINLRLWNEVSQPEILSDIDMDAWKRLCRNYADACALTGMVILVEGVELDLRLPWLRDEDQDWLDAPPPDANEVDLSTADPPS